jgi:peptidoglycan/LPS O-acetylase OafA/YrhL
MTRSPLALPHIPALDGLRGLAVLGILLFHAGHLHGGWLGVDLFFVLSGFLITSLLLTEFENTTAISLRRFWGRRARRLIPALLLVLLGVAGYAAVFAEPSELSRIRADGLATLFYVANWHAISAGQDYWAMFRAPSPLDHAWSLAIEEQFYLFWPPIVLFAVSRFREPTKGVTICATLLALLSALWMIALFDPSEGTARVYFGTDTRAAATLVGAALAAVLRPTMQCWPGESRGAADVSAIGAICLLAAAWFLVEGADPAVYRGGLFVLQLAAAAVIAGVVVAPRGVAARVLAVAPLRLLGVVSYGVYLWHWPLYIVLVPERLGLVGVPLTVVRITATLAVASVSYILLERPIRRGVASPLRLAWSGGVGAVLVVVALLASTPELPPSAPEHPTAVLVAVLPGQRGRDLVIVGDSVAQRLGGALGERAAARGLNSLGLGAFGCVVMDSDGVRFDGKKVIALKHCDAWRNRWRRVIGRNSPQVVLVIEGGAGLGERLVGGEWQRPCTPAYDEAFLSDWTETLTFFAERGARTVIVELPPPVAIDDAAGRSHPWAAAAPDSSKGRMACHGKLRREAARRVGAAVLDMREFVCPAGRCGRRVDGVQLRPDGMHFDGEGASVAADWLLDRLLEQGLLERRGS